MSVCNFSFTESEILVLTDTMQYRERDAAGLCQSKAWISGSGNFVWTCRGSVSVGSLVDDLIASSPDLDAAEEGMMDLFATAKGGGPLGIELTMFGPSGPSRTLRAIRLSIAPGPGTFQFQEFQHGVHLWPGSRVPLGALPPKADEQIMVKLALAQHKISEKYNLGCCIGGVMHLSTVTSSGCRRRLIGTYPGYDEHAARFGDPNRDEVARLLDEKVAA